MRLLGLSVAILLVLGQMPALGKGLMLDEPEPTSFTGYGWTFLGLSLVMAAYAQQSQTAADDALADAQAAYVNYQGADSSTVEGYRYEASRALTDAKVAEEKANGALFLTVLFALTSYYSFFPNHAPDATIIVHPRGVALLYRF